MRFLSILTALLFLQVAFAQTNQIDAKGRKQGKWIKYDENQSLVYSGTFKDDLPVGTFRYYYPYKDTLLRSIMVFKKGGKEAYATNFHMNGKIMAKGKYVNQQKDSVWQFYDEEGYSISTDVYKNDKKNGLSKVYYINGKVFSECMYKDDQKNGSFKEYFDDGKIKVEGQYTKDKQTGKFTYYYPDGKVAATGIFRDGLKHLIWNYNKSDGKPEPKEVYNMGKLLEGKAAEEFLKSQSNKPADNKKGTTKGTNPKGK